MRKYFITGLLIWIPLGITIWVLKLLIDFMDQSLLLLPQAYRPELLFGRYIPGVGAILTALIVFLTGLIAANFFGSKLLRFGESLLLQIPVVKSIYISV